MPKISRRQLLKSAALGVALPAMLAGPETILAASGPAGHHHNNHHHGGHGAGTGFGEPGDPAARARRVKVLMDDSMRFTPSSISVRKGETIRFEVSNRGLQRHEMVLGRMDDLVAHAKEMEKHPDMEHDDPEAVMVEPGETKVLLWRFTEAGDVHFGCLLPGHFSAGMHGRVHVK